MTSKVSSKKIWFFDDDTYNTPSKQQYNFIHFIKIQPGRTR